MTRLSFTSLMSATAPLTVKFGDAAVKLNYRRGLLTSAYMATLAEKDLSTYIAEAVTDWDLQDDRTPLPEGGVPQAYPLTDEALRALPVAFLRTVAQALQEDQAPNSTRRPASSGFIS